ncbi:hypothetical protein [Nocardioides sp. R-C-SC26]|uniref:hypothetical protein n=1 Tax=Nocardioides sp. R-C-SC26 TaxID=2870414 RepID=UPI001E60D93F|nr:hypothetical protein [Nocardioides sp. R-C-SC26]
MRSTSLSPSPSRGLRSLAAGAAGTALLVAGTALLPSAPTAAAEDAPRAAAARATVTFAVEDCEGCELRLHQVTERGDRWVSWSSKAQKVADGEATFRVPRARLQGARLSVSAPWEGHTGYVTMAVFRYGGTAAGDDVSFAEARGARRASGCWAGPGATSSTTIPLVVRRVQVDGVRGRTTGTIAYTEQTQDWSLPMERVYRGVAGAQDIAPCTQGG